MRLILHIGMHKTGSSAIQHVFSRNRWLLRRFGIHYETGGRWPKHTPLFEASSHQNDHGAVHPEHGSVAELLFALAVRGQVVVSAEGLSGPHPGHAAHFAGLNPEVIVVLRDPRDWAVAMHGQMVRSRAVRETRPFAEWCADPVTLAHLDYAALITRWQAVGQVRVVPYQAPILPAFLEAARLPRWIACLPRAGARRNISPDPAQIEQLRRENGGRAGDAADAALLVRIAAEQLAKITELGFPAPW